MAPGPERQLPAGAPPRSSGLAEPDGNGALPGSPGRGFGGGGAGAGSASHLRANTRFTPTTY